MSRILLIVLDGLADRQHPELDGRTPLEAAFTPNLDTLAAGGVTGTMHAISPGIAPSSDQAHFALFGYPLDEFPGRGWLEAVGEGHDPGPGQVVCRASFVTVAERGGVFEVVGREDPRRGADDLGEADLDDELDGVTIRFAYSGARQGFLFLDRPSGPLSPEITDADPFGTGLPIVEVQPLAEARDPEAAARTAGALNRWMVGAHGRLSGRPHDFVVVKWAGQARALQPFRERYGLSGASLGSGPLYRGLALALGLDHEELSEDLARPVYDLGRRLDRAMELLDGACEFVHVHTKVPDHAAHTKDPRHKVEQIEQLDTALERLTRSRLWEDDTVVAVTADHATPSSGPLIHSGEAVPLAVVGGATGRDEVATFDEGACRGGRLGQLVGADLMPVLLNAADRAAFLGQRSTPAPCWGAPPREMLKALRANDHTR